jgi:hypothetical protein
MLLSKRGTKLRPAQRHGEQESVLVARGGVVDHLDRDLGRGVEPALDAEADAVEDVAAVVQRLANRLFSTRTSW